MARKMKDSGIEWIGEIPEGWKLTKVKRIFDIGRGRVISQQELEPTGYPVYSSQTKNNGCLGYISTYDFDRSQLTWTTDGINAGTVFLREGKHNCTNVCGTLAPKNDANDLRYLKYALEYIAFYHKRADINGFKIMNNEMAEIELLLPPLFEQQNIANYLDFKCSQIQSILEQSLSSIEEYKKLKQAVITQAVTKGVRGEREMKDSGVEWIGVIPKDWEIKRLKSFCTIVDCKNRTPDVFPDGKYTVVRTTCIKDCSFSYEGSYQTDTTNFKAWTLKGQPHKGDIFFTREAPVGEACLVPNADNLCMGQRVMFFRPEDSSDARYIMYSIYGPLVREYIASKNSGSTVGHLKLGQVACIPIFYCPPLEQKEIADYLDAKCAEIDKLIAKKEQLVKELENYKKSLIFEYVTGKKELRR